MLISDRWYTTKIDEAHVDSTHDDSFIVSAEFGPSFFDQTNPDYSFFSILSCLSESWNFLTGTRICLDRNEVVNDNFLPCSIDTKV